MGLVRKLADRLGIYDAIRHSRMYEWSLRWRNPQYMRSLTGDLRYFRSVLGERRVNLIFDIGANIGDKAWSFVRIGGRVICVEPDSRCVETLRKRFARNPEVVVLRAAVGEKVGEATLHVAAPGDAYNTLSDKQKETNPSHCETWGAEVVPMTTFDRLIVDHGLPDLIKVDVEGYELPAFRGLSRRVPVVCFEANFPEFRNETLEILGIFEALSPGVRFNVGIIDAYELVFPAHVEGERLRAYFAGIDRERFDVFVFDDGAA